MARELEISEQVGASAEFLRFFSGSLFVSPYLYLYLYLSHSLNQWTLSVLVLSHACDEYFICIDWSAGDIDALPGQQAWCTGYALSINGTVRRL